MHILYSENNLLFIFKLYFSTCKTVMPQRWKVLVIAVLGYNLTNFERLTLIICQVLALINKKPFEELITWRKLQQYNNRSGH